MLSFNSSGLYKSLLGSTQTLQSTSLPIYPSKLVLLGNTGVGKSSLVIQFMRQAFYELQEPTIGACFNSKKMIFDDCIISLEIWDTAGQERFHSLAPMYYRGATAALVVYDVTDMNTYKKAKMWVDELKKSANPNIVIMLVCNKIDLVKGHINTEEARQYAKNNGLLFIETSAKNTDKVNEMFKTIAEAVPRVEKKQEPGTIILSKEDSKTGHICCYMF